MVDAVDGHLVELAVPALELARDVALALGEVAEPHLVDVHGVQGGERLGQRLPGAARVASSSAAAAAVVAQDVALDELHHVERPAVHLGVGAQAEGAGDGHVRRAQGGHDPVLAGHVVGGRQYVADRRPAQGVGVAGRVLDPVGEVGPSAGHQVEGEAVARGRRRGRPATRSPGRSIPGPSAPAAGGVGARASTASMPRRYPLPRIAPERPIGRPIGSVAMVDVTDATFEDEVLRRSSELPVVVDLWAPWCGPCQTLGPIIERVVDATGGAVALAKVNVDENPSISASFQVQSIPAVFALRDGAVVDQFIGALPEEAVEFVERLAPARRGRPDLLVAAVPVTRPRCARRSSSQPDHPGAVAALAGLLIDQGRARRGDRAARPDPRDAPSCGRLAAEARLAGQDVSVAADVDAPARPAAGAGAG